MLGNILERELLNKELKFEDDSKKKPEEKIKVISDSQNIYYQISILNKVVEDPLGVLPSISIPKLAQFSVNRSDTILMNPANYRVAVNRFSLPTSSIPLFLYPENPSYYTITLTYDSNPADPNNVVNQYTKNVTYVPSSIGDPYESSRPVYYIQELINYVNIALQEAYNDAVADLGALVYTPLDRPYLTYDSETKLITMWCETEYLDFNSFGIFMNTTLFKSFFSGLYAREARTNKLTGFNGWQIIPQNLFTNVDLNTTLPDSVTPVDLYKVIEEFSSASGFNQLDRVAITSYELPISSNLLGTQRDVRARILHDFFLEDTIKNNTRYEYRQERLQWTDLKSSDPLTRIDVQIFLVYLDGTILQMFLDGSERLDISLLFVPKGCVYE